MTYRPGTYVDTRTDVTKAQMDNIENELVTLDARGVLLTGATAPQDRSELDPTSGTWGWSGSAGAWFSPAYPVEWVDGDNVAAAAAAGTNTVAVATGPAGSTPNLSQGESPDYPWAIRGSGGGIGGEQAANAGSGVILILQYDTTISGPGSGPVQPTLSPLDYLGDLHLLSTTPVPYATDPGTGKDGDYFYDTTGKRLYGPRVGGAWGTGVLLGLDPAGYAHITSSWLFDGLQAFGAATAPNGALDIAPSQFAMWLDATAGAPVVHFVAQDSAGAVFGAELPMTAL